MKLLKYLDTVNMTFLDFKLCSDLEKILYLLVFKENFSLNVFHLQKEVKEDIVMAVFPWS